MWNSGFEAILISTFVYTVPNVQELILNSTKANKWLHFDRFSGLKRVSELKGKARKDQKKHPSSCCRPKMSKQDCGVCIIKSVLCVFIQCNYLLVLTQKLILPQVCLFHHNVIFWAGSFLAMYTSHLESCAGRINLFCLLQY